MLFVSVRNLYMQNKAIFSVEICYIAPNRQFVKTIDVETGTTISQAIALSGLLETCSDINWEQNKVGIYGKIKSLDTLLNEADRIEIYRPLKMTPIEARRRRLGR